MGMGGHGDAHGIASAPLHRLAFGMRMNGRSE